MNMYLTDITCYQDQDNDLFLDLLEEMLLAGNIRINIKTFITSDVLSLSTMDSQAGSEMLLQCLSLLHAQHEIKASYLHNICAIMHQDTLYILDVDLDSHEEVDYVVASMKLADLLTNGR